MTEQANDSDQSEEATDYQALLDQFEKLNNKQAKQKQKKLINGIKSASSDFSAKVEAAVVACQEEIAEFSANAANTCQDDRAKENAQEVALFSAAVELLEVFIALKNRIQELGKSAQSGNSAANKAMLHCAEEAVAVIGQGLQEIMHRVSTEDGLTSSPMASQSSQSIS